MIKFPKVVSFRITSKCNYNCEYCYAARKEKDMSLYELKKAFSLFKKGGCEAILLCGGEPLIRSDIKDILKEINIQGMKIYLDTNGDFFFNNFQEINDFVSVLGLPIDFYNNSFSFRGNKNFDNIKRILEYYKKTNKKQILRIGTVVTTKNFKYLQEIGEFLKDYPIDVWKIYQFTPSETNTNSYKNQENLNVDPFVFDSITKEIKLTYSKYFEVVISKRMARNKAYFLVKADGTVFMPSENEMYAEDIEIGNIFDKDIFNKWKKVISNENYLNNIKSTFRS